MAVCNILLMHGNATTMLVKLVVTRADQNTGDTLLEFPVRTAMHRKSRVSSATKYDFFKLDDSGNCIIGKTWLHCI